METKQLSPTPAKKVFNQNIEALRGFAALSVFLYHLIINPEFNMGYEFRSEFFPYSPPGHLMVMVFFMLSGYVIGLTNKEGAVFQPLSYLQKRFVRLYPIYLIAILITIALFRENLNIVMGNLVFIQNFLVDNLQKNKALWSLNHEVIYYLAAIPLLYYRIKPLHIILVLSMILCVHFWIFPLHILIEAYSVGGIFWLLGCWLSRQPVTREMKPSRLLSVLILFLGCDFLNIISVALARIPHFEPQPMGMQGIVNYGDLASLPVCLYAMLVFTGTCGKWQKTLFFIVYGSCLLHLGYLIASGSFFKAQEFQLPAFFIVASLLIYQFENLQVRLEPLIWLGSISYAVYVIHTPVFFAFEYVHFAGGTIWYFVLRTCIVLPLVIFLAYLLEKKMQPLIRAKFGAN